MKIKTQASFDEEMDRLDGRIKAIRKKAAKDCDETRKTYARFYKKDPNQIADAGKIDEWGEADWECMRAEEQIWHQEMAGAMRLRAEKVAVQLLHYGIAVPGKRLKEDDAVRKLKRIGKTGEPVIREIFDLRPAAGNSMLDRPWVQEALEDRGVPYRCAIYNTSVTYWLSHVPMPNKNEAAEYGLIPEYYMSKWRVKKLKRAIRRNPHDPGLASSMMEQVSVVRNRIGDMIYKINEKEAPS
jgi:hypothetical protein